MLIFWRLLIGPPGWVLLLALICLALVIAFGFLDPLFLAVLAGQALILLTKQWADLQQRPYSRRRVA